MDNKLLQSTIEAILFAAGEPVPIERIAVVCGVTEDEVAAEAKALADYYSFNSRGICLVRMEDKLQLCSASGFADEIIHALEKRRPPKLSQPALGLFEIVHIYRHRLCPTEFKHDHHKKAQNIDVLYWVECQPARIFCGVVAELVRDKAVAQFVERDTQQRGNNSF